MYSCALGAGIFIDAECPAVDLSAVHDVCHYEGVDAALLGVLAWRLSDFFIFGQDFSPSVEYFLQKVNLLIVNYLIIS